MTEHAPGDDTRAQDREDVPIGSLNAGQPASAHGNPGAIAVPEEPIAPLAPALAMAPSEYAEPPAADLIAQQAGVEPKARSQWGTTGCGRYQKLRRSPSCIVRGSRADVS